MSILFSPPHPDPGHLMIGEGVVFNGKVESAQDVSIYGSFTGQLSAPSIFTGKNSQVEGHISGDTVVVGGRLGQELTARELLHAKSTAVIAGRVEAKNLSADRGAQIVGTTLMVRNIV